MLLVSVVAWAIVILAPIYLWLREKKHTSEAAMQCLAQAAPAVGPTPLSPNSVPGGAPSDAAADELLSATPRCTNSREKEHERPRDTLGESSGASAPAADEPQTAVQSPSVPGAKACLACKRTRVKLLRCSRCQEVYFCNRECQRIAAKQGHRGDGCRPAATSPMTASRVEAKSRPIAVAEPPAVPLDPEAAFDLYHRLLTEGSELNSQDSRSSYIASAAKLQHAAAVANVIGGSYGAGLRSAAERVQAHSMVRAGDTAGAARVACASVASARAGANRTLLVEALVSCAIVARSSPDDMVRAEEEMARCEQAHGPAEGSALADVPAAHLPSTHTAPDLSNEGRVEMPTGVERAWLCLHYSRAAVGICDTAVAATAAGGSPVDDAHIPSLDSQASARSNLARFLVESGLDPARGVALLREAAALRRRLLAERPNRLHARRVLAIALSNLGAALARVGSEAEMEEADACMREALQLSDATHDVGVQKGVLTNLINRSGETPEGADGEKLRSRLNQIYRNTGRDPDTHCAVCLEPLKPIGDDGVASSSADRPTDSHVNVLGCGHQFHQSCIMMWRERSHECPVCKASG